MKQKPITPVSSSRKRRVKRKDTACNSICTDHDPQLFWKVFMTVALFEFKHKQAITDTSFYGKQ